jgi:hypothetical protein
MALYKPSMDVMVDSINRLNKLDLVVAEYVWSAPAEVTPAVGLLNTSIKITAKNQQSAYAGEMTLRYHRNPLSDLATQVELIVPVKELNTTKDIIDAMNKRFGTVFTAEDIVVRDLTTEEKVVGTPIQLDAVPTSLAWIGSTMVGTRTGGLILGDYLKNTRLNGLNYPSPTTTRPYAQIYSYWRNMSTSYNQLKDIVVGTDQLSIIRDVLAFQTNDPWLLTGSGRYSLQGAEVTAVGLCRDNPDISNTKYDFFIKVRLSDTYSIGLTGDLTLHFDEPVIQA